MWDPPSLRLQGHHQARITPFRKLKDEQRVVMLAMLVEYMGLCGWLMDEKDENKLKVKPQLSRQAKTRQQQGNMVFVGGSIIEGN